MLGIPALVPAFLAAYSVVGERQQGTLEPVLTTPIRREEFLLGKALAALVPSLAVAYVVYALVRRVRRAVRPARRGLGAASAARTCSPSWSSRRCSPPGRSGSASRSPPDPATSASRSSSARWRACRRSLVAALIAFNVIHADARLALGARGAAAGARRTRLADRVGDVRPRAADHRHSLTRTRPRPTPAPPRLVPRAPGSPVTLSGVGLDDVGCATASRCFAVGLGKTGALVEKA